MRYDSIASVCVFVLVAFASGCVGGLGARRSHFARAIASPVQSTPMRREAELDVSASWQDVETGPAATSPDSPSQITPEFSLGLGGRAALGDYVYLGGQLDWAFQELAAPNEAGAPPGRGDRVAFSLGPLVGVNLPFADGFVDVGFFASGTFSLGWVNGVDAVDRGAASLGSPMVFYRVGGVLHVFPIEPLVVELGIAVQNYVRNDTTGSSTMDAHGVVPYIGGRLTSDIGLYGYVQVHFPIGFDYTGAFPVAGHLGVGVTFGDVQVRPTPL